MVKIICHFGHFKHTTKNKSKMKRGNLTPKWLFSQNMMKLDDNLYFASFNLKNDLTKNQFHRALEVELKWRNINSTLLTIKLYYDKGGQPYAMNCLKANVFSSEMFSNLVNNYLAYYDNDFRFKPLLE